MAYVNYPYFSGSSFSGYAGGYSSGYNNVSNRRYSPVAFPKRSGCRMKKVGKDGVVLWGWRKNKSGMYSFYARPYSKSKHVESQSGKHWVNMFVTITNKSTMQKSNHSAMYDIDGNKLYMKELNLIANPKALNGGYWGTHIRKNYRR